MAIVRPNRGIARLPTDEPFRLNRNSNQAKGLVGWYPSRYPGAGLVPDLSGRGYDLSFDGSGDPAWTGDAERGRVLGYETDSSQHLLLSRSPIADEPITLSAWIKDNGTMSDYTVSCAVSIGSSSARSGFSISVGKWAGPALVDATTQTSWGERNAQSYAAVDTFSDWTLITGVISSDVYRAVYQNGLFVASNTESISPDNTLNELAIGADYSAATTTRYADLLIDDVRIYNRALSAEEVYQLWHPSTRWELYDTAVTSRQWVVAPAAGGPTYTLNCDAGSYTVTGQDATLQFTRKLAADAGSYTVTGQDATLAVSRKLTPATSSYDYLSSWWSLDETSGTRADSHGSNGLTAGGSVSYATGKQGNAADFENGTNDVLYRSDTSSLDGGDQDFAIALWYKVESYDAGTPYLVSKSGLLNNYDYYIVAQQSGGGDAGKPRFRIGDGSTSFLGAVQWDTAIATDEWHLLIAWHDASEKKLWLQIDNETPQSNTYTGTAASGSADFRVGAASVGGLSHDGLIDEFVFVQGAFFTADERAALWSDGNGITYAEFVAGRYNVTGHDATLAYNRKLSVDAGSYTVTGQDATLAVSRKLTTYDYLSSWWSMDETSGSRADSHNSYDLTDQNTVGYADGQQGNAADFTSGNDYLWHLDTPELRFGDRDWAIAGWYRVDSWTSFARLVHKSGELIISAQGNGDAKPFAFLYDNTSTLIAECTWSTALSLNTWYFFCAWHDASTNTLYFQINDGTPISDTYTETPGSFNLPFAVGATSAGSLAFDGRIDELVYVAGATWTADERAALYNSGNGITYAEFVTGRYNVTGHDATLAYNRKLSVDAGSYTVTGQDATLAVSRKLALDAGSYTVTGQDAELNYSGADYSLVCDAGSYTVSGQEVTLAYNRKLFVDAGSYTVTGQDPTLAYGRVVALDAGSYTVTGQDPTLAYGRVIDLDSGSYTVAGQDPTLAVSRKLALDAGSYTVTGQAATLTHVYNLSLDAGSYTVTGQTAGLAVARKLALDAGTYTTTGQDPTLVVSRVLVLDAGSYTLSGQAVAFLVARMLVLNADSYTVTGYTLGALRYSGEVYHTLTMDAVMRFTATDDTETRFTATGNSKTRFTATSDTEL